MKVTVAFIVGLIAGAGLLWIVGMPTGQPAADQAEDASRWDRRQQISYGVGYGLAYEVAAGLAYDEVDVDAAIVGRGFTDGLSGQTSAIEPRKLEQVMVRLEDEVQKRVAEKLKASDPDFARRCEENLAASRAFVESQRQRPGMKTFDNGIVYEVIESGNGPSPSEAGRAVVAGRILLPDGSVVSEAERVSVYVDTATDAARYVLPKMKVGDHWRVVVPPELAYGVGGKAPLIGPNMALVYDVKLVEAEP